MSLVCKNCGKPIQTKNSRRGYCWSCYNKIVRPDYFKDWKKGVKVEKTWWGREKTGKGWVYYQECRECHTRAKPHYAHGMCRTCYNRWRRNAIPIVESHSDLSEKILERDKKRLIESPFGNWLLRHWIISSGEARGNVYSFKDHRFLIPIVYSKASHLVLRKSAQIGASEMTIAKLFFLACNKRGNALYAFHRYKYMRNFYRGRIRPALAVNPYLADRLKKFRGAVSASAEVLQIDDNIIYFTGAAERGQMLSVDASSVFLDEVDEMFAGALTLFEKRLGAAKDPYFHIISTPTLPDVGVSSEYDRSDKRRWMIPCAHCSNWIDISFGWKYVQERGGQVSLFCPKCGKAVDRLAYGEWVPEDRSVDIEGYQLNKIMWPRASLAKMWRDYHDPQRVAEFYRSDLGLPYTPKGARIRREDLQMLVRRGLHHRKFCHEYTYLGADVSQARGTCYVITRIEPPGKRVTIARGIVKTPQDLRPIFKRYNVAVAVIDYLPETVAVRELVGEPGHTTKVFAARAQTSPASALWRRSESIPFMISYNRNDCMAEVMEQFLTGRRVLAEEDITDEEYVEQLCTPIKAESEDALGNKMYVFPKLGTDDYFFAEVFNWLATQIKPGRVRQILSLL